MNNNNTDKATSFRWIICSLLFFATTVNYLDRQVLSLTYKDFIAPVFGWSDNDYGTITDRKSTRLNSSHYQPSRMPSSA